MAQTGNTGSAKNGSQWVPSATSEALVHLIFLNNSATNRYHLQFATDKTEDAQVPKPLSGDSRIQTQAYATPKSFLSLIVHIPVLPQPILKDLLDKVMCLSWEVAKIKVQLLYSMITPLHCKVNNFCSILSQSIQYSFHKHQLSAGIQSKYWGPGYQFNIPTGHTGKKQRADSGWVSWGEDNKENTSIDGQG